MPAQITVFAALALLVLSQRAGAALDLRNATVEQLDNGLTVILLEDRNFPVVSTQMLYRAGARDESYGQTGIAHFLEHMAFRGSKNFPDAGLVGSIYAVGGEWHGYTWIDQTAYFATVPKEHADLLLRIEADRMARLDISPGDMDAERGAVLAEMHMYENYPAAVLLDALLFTSFQGHPYRNNTIGWESDIAGLQHAEVLAFYERYYQPANAVLAVVGDFEREPLRARIEALFGGLESAPPAPLPRTVEPPQRGERRVRLYGRGDERRFMIAYRAPSANHADFSAFLVLQEILGAGSGVNFRQNDWGTPVDGDAVLDGVAAELTTWYPPSAEDYVFVIGGTVAGDADEAALEAAIESRLAAVRQAPPGRETLAEAIDDVLDDLAFDVQTTEDAAHQLAYFAGLGALEVLRALPRRVAAVTAADVQRAAAARLAPGQRTIGWSVPGPGPARNDAPEIVPRDPPAPAGRPAAPVDEQPVSAPVLRRLRGGLPAIVQASDFSPTAHLRMVVRGDGAGDLTANDPVLGHASYTADFRPERLRQSLRAASAALAAAVRGTGERALSLDPETRLEQTLAGIMSGGAGLLPDARAPSLLVVSGDVDPERAFDLLEAEFGDRRPPPDIDAERRGFDRSDIDVHLGVPVAQAQLAYVAPAPGPADRSALAWRMLLYILSHDYAGRLGKEAISERGLVYYIDARYRSDGRHGWITLSAGVDPGKVASLEALFGAELDRLRTAPPTAAEIEEARRHLSGRARSAAQSNEELSARLATDWLWHGDVPSAARLARALAEVERQDVLDIVPAFVSGVTVVVDE